MIAIVLNIFIGLNILAGAYFVFMGFAGGGEKPASFSVMSVVWALVFLGLAWAVWSRQPFARMWAVILYGLIGVVTLLSLIGEFLDPQSRIVQYPLIYGGVYLIWLALTIGPVVFMLRRDVKEHFSAQE